MADAALRTEQIGTGAFAEDVRVGLTSRPKQIPARWLYDRLGSALFEAICALPWYPVTRAERRLFEQHAHSIACAAGDPSLVAELGPGSGEKLALLLRAIHARGGQPSVHLVDVSRAALDAATRTLLEAGAPNVSCTSADYAGGIVTLRQFRPRSGSALVAFLGSNIGNFHRAEAVGLLNALATVLGAGDRVLLGADLVKSADRLQLAYDDPLGVTAAFNKNLLLRMNRELCGHFDLAAFQHRAAWNDAESRIEMHLVSTRAQAVTIPGAGCTAEFEEGESIWTESSYKYTLESLDTLASEAGLALVERWTDDEGGFAVTMLEVASGGTRTLHDSEPGTHLRR